MNCVTAEECLSLFGNLPTELRVEVFVRLPVTVMLEVMGAELLMDEFEYIGKLQSDVISRRDPTAFVLTSRNIANSWRHFVVASDVMILLSYLGSCQENESLIVCGTSRGYTCHVYRNYTDRKILIVLFNPSVNHQVVLPAPDIPVTFGFQNLYRGGLEDLYRDDDCCFGFLGDSNAFKVLRFANATDAEIFRSEENRWCKLILDWPCIDGGFISLKKDPKLPLMLLPRPVTYFIGQKFYWIAADEGFDFKAIVSLDINSESFEITTTVDEPYASNLQLGIVGGHLYVHKRIAGAGCAISLVKTELAWKACQEEHLYPAAFYHQFVETGAYEIPVFPFSQTLGNPKLPSSGAISANSDHEIVFLPYCNYGSGRSPLSTIDQNTSFDVPFKPDESAISRTPPTSLQHALPGTFRVASSKSAKVSSKTLSADRKRVSETMEIDTQGEYEPLEVVVFKVVLGDFEDTVFDAVVRLPAEDTVDKAAQGLSDKVIADDDDIGRICFLEELGRPVVNPTQEQR
ncbi:hypothetical protein ACET3Z_024905 [Daucus carota]